MKKGLFILFAFVAVIYSCQKATTPASNDTAKQFTYSSLTTDHDTIKQGNVTNIRANVSGTASSYAWSVNSGDIFGSGNIVLFGAATCCTGNHTITCKVSDSRSNSESKTVIVYVKP